MLSLITSMFLFSDIQQIMTNPVQAVNDAADEVSSLLNKFQGTQRETACMSHVLVALKQI